MKYVVDEKHFSNNFLVLSIEIICKIHLKSWTFYFIHWIIDCLLESKKEKEPRRSGSSIQINEDELDNLVEKVCNDRLMVNMLEYILSLMILDVFLFEGIEARWIIIECR